MAGSIRSGSDVPPKLVESIRAGSCVAFVGAGFSSPDLPAWSELLRDLAALLDRDQRNSAESLIGSHNEEAAQLIRDELGERFEDEIRRCLQGAAVSSRMKRRTRWIRGIPFRCILTTNYDAHLEGRTPSPEAYRALLRPDPRARWWSEERYWANGGERGPEVLQLHGSLKSTGSLVLARRDYRRQLYLSPGYASFLRAILSSHTVLYLGVSFNDVYLNELRSEILALIGHSRTSDPTGYAILPDVAPARQKYYREHEGIEILPYETGDDAAHAGFDAWLEVLHDATNPRARFGRNLASKRILWLDPNRGNNDAVYRVLASARAAARRSRENDLVVEVATSTEALVELETAARRFDLVITHWGFDRATDGAGNPVPAAVHLLTEMRRRDLRCPVMVFSIEQDADRRRTLIRDLGALGYFFHFEGLLRALDDFFSPAEEIG